jgi:hypothetical protein
VELAIIKKNGCQPASEMKICKRAIIKE